eukprot:195914-Amphidinium_carterae.3
MASTGDKYVVTAAALCKVASVATSHRQGVRARSATRTGAITAIPINSDLTLLGSTAARLPLMSGWWSHAKTQSRMHMADRQNIEWWIQWPTII